MKKTSSIIKFIKNYFKQANRKFAILGLSGGLDSSVVLMLCVKALGPNFVYPIFMDYKPLTSQESFENAKKAVKSAKIPKNNFIIEDITVQLDIFKKKHLDIGKIDFGNKMCRERMSILYYYARKLKGLVVGTSNKSETLLGYFTLHGDGASDIAPMSSLYKTEVKKLAKILKVPQEIIDIPPSADFWPGQTDEGELGFSYAMADKILKKYVDENLSIEQIEKTGISNKAILRVLQRYQANKFKLKSTEIMRYNK
ncbi:NAD+ synthase [Candidatus Microgenomates bacterium]|nr:NAD+ synthase [Candidatus Microgenomates bacterium]